MDPVTHFLTGACIGRAGFNRKTAYATLAAVLAAEAADLDVLWGLAGPVEGLKHHRGITHTFIAAPVVAGVIVGAVWLLDRARSSWKLRDSRRSLSQAASTASGGFSSATAVEGNGAAASSPVPRPGANPERPVRWLWLYAAALVAALSHLLLDWTNNYGLRPFYPFNPRWYEGSFVFIAEPVLWALLVLAVVVPWLLGLADREIGARRKPFRGQGWAIFALAGMVVLWCWRWGEHAQGLVMLENAQVASEPVMRMALEPYPVNPYRWHAILETRDFYQTAEVNTWDPSSPAAIVSNPERAVLYKPVATPAVEAAKQTPLGRVYLDWGAWAVVRDVGPEPVAGMPAPDLPPNRRWSTVEFSDLRFDYSFLATRSPSGQAPLAGWVYIVDGREVAGEAMNGREQH